MVEFMEQGSSAIKDLTSELDQFNGVMSEKTILSLKNFNDSLVRVGQFFVALRDQLAAALAPEISDMLLSFKEWLVVNREFIKIGLLGFVKALVSFLRVGAQLVKAFFDPFLSYLKFVYKDSEKVARNLAIISAILAFMGGTAVVAGIMKLVNGIRAFAAAVTLAEAAAFLIPALITACIS